MTYPEIGPVKRGAGGTPGGVRQVVAGLLMTVAGGSLLNTLMMLGLLFARLGLVARSLRSA